jgi:hypothetical protein
MRTTRRFTRITMLAFLAMVSCCQGIRAAEAGTPMRHGVVFFCPEDDVATLGKGTLVIWTKRVPRPVADAILALPQGVRVSVVDSPPGEDEYGRKLPASTAAALIVALARAKHEAEARGCDGSRKRLPLL